MSKTASLFTETVPPLSGGCHFLSLKASDQGPGLRAWLNLPQGEAPKQGWPVLIVLDGESYFTATAEIAQRLSQRTAKTRIQPLMVVGLAPEVGQDRVATYAFSPGPGVETPLGPQVLSRLLDEILPALVEQGADASRVTLVGHSMSGLFVVEAMAAGAGLARYAALSPSIWWKAQGVADLKAPENPAPLMLAVGALEEASRETPSSDSRQMVTNTMALGRQWSAPVEVCEDEDHGSVVYRLLPTVLRFASALT